VNDADDEATGDRPGEGDHPGSDRPGGSTPTGCVLQPSVARGETVRRGPEGVGDGGRHRRPEGTASGSGDIRHPGTPGPARRCTGHEPGAAVTDGPDRCCDDEGGCRCEQSDEHGPDDVRWRYGPSIGPLRRERTQTASSPTRERRCRSDFVWI
jgi:hypothetical protein